MQIINVSRYAIVGFGVFMGVLAIILQEIGLSLGWVYLFMVCPPHRTLPVACSCFNFEIPPPRMENPCPSTSHRCPRSGCCHAGYRYRVCSVPHLLLPHMEEDLCVRCNHWCAPRDLWHHLPACCTTECLRSTARCMDLSRATTVSWYRHSTVHFSWSQEFCNRNCSWETSSEKTMTRFRKVPSPVSLMVASGSHQSCCCCVGGASVDEDTAWH